MSRFPILAALLLSLSLALAPAAAEARAGSSLSRGPIGMSQGSAGSRTYAPSIGAPVQRSITPNTQTAPSYRPATPAYPGYGGGLFGGGFMSGLFGGLLGAGIGHMLFGGGYGYGYGGLGAGGIIGSLLHLMLWGLIIWFVFRLFRRMFGGGPAFNTASYRDGGYAGGSSYSPFGYNPGAGGGYAGAAPAGGSTIPITDEDYNAFSQLLVDIQNAWSRGDINALRRYMTPEMQSYFSEELSRNASDGVENRVEDVQFQNGSLQQAWNEGDIDYAQALMGWNAKDYYVRNDRNPGDRDYVAKGDPNQPVPAQELWTFMRRHGGNWLLSAIQQV